jgi:hypothetical protein|tara:strand:- start:491 stop:2101 length:1611 start_codon:yes stop_codon:yes gene_type:complete
MPTSTLGAVIPARRRRIRMALPFAMLLLVVAAAPVIAGPYDAEIAQIREDIEEKLDLITGQQDRISGFEDDLVALDHQIIDTDSAISIEDVELRVLPVRLELLADQFIQILASRSEPAILHQTMAVDAYLRNDERMNAVLTQSAQLAADSLDGVRDRMLYESVIDESRRRLDVIDAELRLSADAVRGLRGLVVEAEERRQAAMDALSGTRDAKPPIRVAIGDARTSIQNARTSIAGYEVEILRLEQLAVTRTWTGIQGTDIGRPALAVKIDNVTRAHPQSGLTAADVVYEEIVEGGVTRLVAVFQSTSADVVGPVRSARTSDPPLLTGFDRPLLAYSGANRGTMNELADSTMVDVGYDAMPSEYWRSRSRRPPHNLYTSTDGLWASHPERTSVPPAPFAYRYQEQDLHPAARPATGVSIDFGLTEVDYDWNGAGWARTHGGNPHVDDEGARVAPTNVVVQFVSYGWSKADRRSPEARTTGSGEAWVFTAGHVVVGEWSRPDASLPATFYADGEEIRLSPGTTWVALARKNTATWRD